MVQEFQEHKCIYANSDDRSGEVVTNCYKCAAALCRGCGWLNKQDGYVYCNECINELGVIRCPLCQKVYDAVKDAEHYEAVKEIDRCLNCDHLEGDANEG